MVFPAKESSDTGCEQFVVTHSELIYMICVEMAEIPLQTLSMVYPLVLSVCAEASSPCGWRGPFE